VSRLPQANLPAVRNSLRVDAFGTSRVGYLEQLCAGVMSTGRHVESGGASPAQIFSP